jgi:hypothetical protein
MFAYDCFTFLFISSENRWNYLNRCDFEVSEDWRVMHVNRIRLFTDTPCIVGTYIIVELLQQSASFYRFSPNPLLPTLTYSQEVWYPRLTKSEIISPRSEVMMRPRGIMAVLCKYLLAGKCRCIDFSLNADNWGVIGTFRPNAILMR